MCFLECAGDDRGAPTMINSAVMMFKVPCPSRIESNEMIDIHNAETAYTIVPECLSSHGIVLDCSHSYCCGDSTGKQFIYCAFCKEAVSQEMFGAFHAHVDEENEPHSCPHATISPTFRALKARKQSSSSPTINENVGGDTKRKSNVLDFEEAEDDDQPRPSKKVASHEDVVQVQVGTKDATESGSLFTYPDPAAVPSADELIGQYFDLQVNVLMSQSLPLRPFNDVLGMEGLLEDIPTEAEGTGDEEENEEADGDKEVTPLEELMRCIDNDEAVVEGIEMELLRACGQVQLAGFGAVFCMVDDDDISSITSE
jgi:hypothetical protein